MDRRHAVSPPVAGLRLAGAALLLALVAGGVPAEMLRARGAGGELLLVRSAAEHTVRLAGGEQAVLPLSARATAGDLRAAGARWWVAAVEQDADGPRLALFEGRGGAFEALPEPAAGRARVVHGPQLLTDGRGLRGVAWLEGDAVTRLEVRAAGWRDGGWTAPVTVSPVGPGTQIALTVVRLADGSWLAAWSAFDGRDDEILWSRLAGGVWSAPRNVAEDNRVPDITPTLSRSGSGALLAWARYDGNDYRVHSARFVDGGWSEPAKIGPKGSVDPSFGGEDLIAGGKTALVFRRAVPSNWLVAELDAAGKVLRTAEAPGRDERPAVAAITADGAVLAWADGSATARWQK